MCLICIEWEKGKMSFTEATRALGEMGASIGEEHVAEVKKMLIDAMQEQYATLTDEIRQSASAHGYVGPEEDEYAGIIPPDDTAAD